jgi:hypothetical protein
MMVNMFEILADPRIYQSCGLTIISQKIASTAANAEKSETNHSRNRR